MTRPIVPAALLSLAAATPSLAQLPTYGPLELRGLDPFVVGNPPGLTIDYVRPVINNRGDVAVPVANRIWFNGTLLHTEWAQLQYIQHLSMSGSGVLTWWGSTWTRPLTPWFYTLFRYDTANPPDEVLDTPPEGDVEHVPVINDAGQIAFFATPDGASGAAILRWDPATQQTTTVVPNDPAIYSRMQALWLAQNNAGQLAVVDSRGSAEGGGVKRVEPDGSLTLMSGELSGIREHVDINDAGHVAFRTVLGAPGIYRSDGATITRIVPTDPTEELASLLDTPMVINNQGWIAFSARTQNNVEGIYIADAGAIRRIAAVGDTLMSHAGPARISRLDRYGLDMNDAGDVAFIAELTHVQGQYFLGRGIIVARAGATCRGDWNTDGAVNSADISAFLTTWLTSISMGTLDADFDASGAVNSADIAAFLSNWLAFLGPGC